VGGAVGKGNFLSKGNWFPTYDLIGGTGGAIGGAIGGGSN
jgi:hypothetical protein